MGVLIKRHVKRHIPTGSPDNFLSLLEGLEGGLAIFAGIIAGLSFQVTDRRLLIITGLIGIIISGFNSSAVRYSSEHYVDELDGREKRSAFKHYFIPAAIEFLAYVVVALLVLLPLIIFPSIRTGVIVCSVLAVTVLFGAGLYRGWLLRTHPLKDALELSLLGAGIIAIGALAGYIISL